MSRIEGLSERQKKRKEAVRKSNSEYYAANKQRIREQQRSYYEENKKKRCNQVRRYYYDNKETILSRLSEFRKNNVDKVREQRRRSNNKVRTNPKNRIDIRVNSSVRHALRRVGSRKSAPKALVTGWNVDDLMCHLEPLFEEGMSWENMDTWHIDHIIPLSAVSYESDRDPLFKMVWALNNLAPLWAKDNLEKNANVHWQLPDTYKNPRLRELYDTRDIALFVFG